MLDTLRARNLIAAILVGLFWLPHGSLGQVFPINPIRMIVPWPPGGGTDRLARVLAERMSDHLGQRVIIENISGAGGTTGSSRAAKAAPDGYTIIMGNIGTH